MSLKGLSRMAPTFKDLETGETAKSTLDCDFTWWSEGNGSCDCNRQYAFGRDDGNGFCLGNKRYIAVDVDGDLEGMEKQNVIFELNVGYPVNPDDFPRSWDVARQ